MLAEARARIRRYAADEALAAALLVALGVDAGDLIEGYEAW